MIDAWPRLPVDEWKPTYDTLHLWTQVVGKIQLRLVPFVNHWWEAGFQVSARGLRTRLIPHAQSAFELEFDFIDHVLWLHAANGRRSGVALLPRTVGEFHREVLRLLSSAGIEVRIDPKPCEIPGAIPFDQDAVHSSYEPEYARRHWRLLLQAERLLQRFRGGFVGKQSGVYFYWGTFDLAHSRFSGRRAPPRPGADRITRLAYSHEVWSCGFWPGSHNVTSAAFYAYVAPQPPGYPDSDILPAGVAYYNPPTHGHVLKIDELRDLEDPDRAVLEFLSSSYEAAARLASWDRAALAA